MRAAPRQRGTLHRRDESQQPKRSQRGVGRQHCDGESHSLCLHSCTGTNRHAPLAFAQVDWTRVAAGKRVPDPQEGRAFARPWEWRHGEKTMEQCRHECLQHPECAGIEFCGPVRCWLLSRFGRAGHLANLKSVNIARRLAESTHAQTTSASCCPRRSTPTTPLGGIFTPTPRLEPGEEGTDAHQWEYCSKNVQTLVHNSIRPVLALRVAFRATQPHSSALLHHTLHVHRFAGSRRRCRFDPSLLHSLSNASSRSGSCRSAYEANQRTLSVRNRCLAAAIFCNPGGISNGADHQVG